MFGFGIAPVGSTNVLRAYFQPDNDSGNWAFYLNDRLVGDVGLSFRASMVLFLLSRTNWAKLNKALLEQCVAYGYHLRGPDVLCKRIYLNFFPDDKAYGDTLVCEKHSVGEDCSTCFRCGAYCNEDEEEENEADYCSCGFAEDECQCPVCRVCGEKETGDCICEICDTDTCMLCICDRPEHIDKHRPCDCEVPCSPKKRATTHPIVECFCRNSRCADCDMSDCECDSSSYAFTFD